jgi:bleomycin hydrolase
VDSKVCLVSDPRPSNPTGKIYTVDCLGNVVGGRPTLYNNQPIQVLIDLASKTLQAGHPVWFGCDVSKHMASKHGSLDDSAHDYELALGTDIHKVMSKADRLIYGDSQMNHAMVLTAVHVDEVSMLLTL